MSIATARARGPLCLLRLLRVCPKSLGLAATLALLGSAQGCGMVAPYEREFQASLRMDLSRERAANKFRGHVFDAREGAFGGADSTGGGCGCN